jgi:hypothetical protein
MMTFTGPTHEEIISGFVLDEEIGLDIEVHRGMWENDLPHGLGIRNYPNGQV